MKYLLAISIGPVQDFIATARRSRDLWFGSWLLSEISKAAAKKIADDCGGRENLIFPSIAKDEDLEPVTYKSGARETGTGFTVVNKIVALVDTDPRELCEGAEGIKQGMNERLEAIRGIAYDALKKSWIDQTLAKKQVHDLIEFYWAAHPVREDLSNYKEARDEAEALLAARKNLRNFNQVTRNSTDDCGWGSSNPKSSLDGDRESVIDEEVYKKFHNGELTKEQLREGLGIREGERLCGVGLLKRHGNRQGDGSFFSTSHVAALPLLQQLTDKHAVGEYICQLAELLGVLTDKEFKALKATADTNNEALRLPTEKNHQLRKKIGFVPERATIKVHDAFDRWDGHLLFEERLGEFFEDDDKLKQAKNALRKFLKRALNDERPKPYYALLLGDGDRMGEAIDAKESKQEHQVLSAQLSKFASQVGLIVEGGTENDKTEEGHNGSLIYAGGDDVLAFLPLHEALFCARRLADEFRAAMNDEATLSIGIAIGHHLDPLQDILELARRAEKAAKKVKGKNALAIIVSKRSGADWEVKGSWSESANGGALDRRLNRFIYLRLAEELPRGVGYELRETALRLGGMELDAALRDEAVRILGRKRKASGEAKVTPKVFDELKGYLRNPNLSVEDLAYEFIVARVFSDATKQAGIDAGSFAAMAQLTESGDVEKS